MFFLNNYTTMVIVTILLSLKGFYSPHSQTSSCASCGSPSSQTSRTNPSPSDNASSSLQPRKDINHLSANKMMEIIACRQEIENVFDGNLFAPDHIKIAINKFRRDGIIIEPEDDPRLYGYAKVYYDTFYKYAVPGDLRSIDDFCYNQPSNCQVILLQLFGFVEPNLVLYNALYVVNRAMVESVRNDFANAYFDEILLRLRVNYDPDPVNVKRFRGPFEICYDSIVNQ